MRWAPKTPNRRTRTTGIYRSAAAASSTSPISSRFTACIRSRSARVFQRLHVTSSEQWQLSAGLTLHTGSPFTIITPGNSANTGRGTIRPNRLADGNLPSDQQTPTRWFDTAAFVAPPLYTFGNSGRGIIEGPATKLLDISITRRFTIREGHTLQFRGDLFNSTNTPQFGIPGRTVGNADFGRISTTGSAREIQLGLRYAF